MNPCRLVESLQHRFPGIRSVAPGAGIWLIGAWLLLGPGLVATASGAVVEVSVELETNRIRVGEITALHVYARILPAFTNDADRIFSWFVDARQTNSVVAPAIWDSLNRTASDRDPRTSSSGYTTNETRRGIYDTFLQLPGAGVAAPVELFVVPVVGQAAGRTRFEILAGSGVANLSTDFIVAPAGGGAPLTGGIYSAAAADLDVVPACEPRLAIAHQLEAGGRHRAHLTWEPCPGFLHVVEYRDTLAANDPWRPLPGYPHADGQLDDLSMTPGRFYRLSAFTTAAELPCEPRLAIEHVGEVGGGHRVTIRFSPCPGYDHVVEYRDGLTLGSSWQPLPGGPHNTGSLVDVNPNPMRFYRVLASVQAAPF